MSVPPRESLRDKKRRWFQAGAADFAVSCPEILRQLGPPTPPIYCCPLCARPDSLKVFPESSLDNRSLTVDDVPPKHSGGRPLVLTCRVCNNTAGSTIDAAANEAERGRDFLAGRGSSFVKMEAGGNQLGATLDWQKDGSGYFKLFKNKQERLDGFRDIVTGKSGDDRSFKVSFRIRTIDDRMAQASWLKSAYLAMFALFGYRYAFHPALELVRLQIQDPKKEHIPHFLMRLPSGRPFSELRAFPIQTEQLPMCWGVQMGPYIVFLPADSSGSLYTRIDELRRNKEVFGYDASDCVWPTQPLFVLSSRFLRHDPTKQGRPDQ